MKSQYKLIALALALTLVNNSLPAQESTQQKKLPSRAEQLKLTKPGVEHKKLARYVGEWNVEMKMGSGAKALVYQGTAESRMLVGGRYLQIEYQAKSQSKSTEGIFTLGFDPRHQHFTLIAMDSFGTYFVTSQGKRDNKTGMIRMRGTDDDPKMKAMGYTKEFVHVLDLKSDNEFAVEVLFVDTRTPAKREFKFMEYTFKRKK